MEAATDSKSVAERRGGSSPSTSTNLNMKTKPFPPELIQHYGECTYYDRVRTTNSYEDSADCSACVAEACGEIQEKDQKRFCKEIVKYAKKFALKKFPNTSKPFDKELIKQYGEQTYCKAKMGKITIEKAALIEVYTVRMCGVICVDDGDRFFDAIVKYAKRIKHR